MVLLRGAQAPIVSLTAYRFVDFDRAAYDLSVDTDVGGTRMAGVIGGKMDHVEVRFGFWKFYGEPVSHC